MCLILLSIGLLLCSGVVSLLAGSNGKPANIFGAGGAILGCLGGVVPATWILLTGKSEEIRWAWSVPYGSFSMRVDSLSALFLIPIFILCGLSALYGFEYMNAARNRKSLGRFWFFFNTLAAGMAVVAIAANGILFLMAWEIMALSSFFLVTFDNEDKSVQRAGWIYLTATHLGTAFLLVLFLLLGHQCGAGLLDFDLFLAARSHMAPMANVIFILAVIGFGAKAGFIPFHVWLPEAHPAAPSPVSAVMSGVMIKTGIYGLLRTLSFLENPAPWWGWLLIGVGLVSGILGVLFALAQHDLKRLLAYHSVENIGIITLGLGLGLLGVSMKSPALAVFGFGGGLLHVVNHALFKGLLFLGAGSVQHATGTRAIDRLGGLIKQMPWTAATFLIGAVAISGLPPLNGFISEFLIYAGAFHAVGEPHVAAAGAVVILALALIGGLAAACFTKAFGIVFLGLPRSAEAAHVHEAGWAMRIPTLVLAAGCILVALFAPKMVMLTTRAVGIITMLPASSIESSVSFAVGPMSSIVLVAGLFALIAVLSACVRHGILSGRTVEQTCTWDCGYVRPAASMQYTASSFAQPLTKMFEALLRPKVKLGKPDGLFPGAACFHSETGDLFTRSVYRPLFAGVELLASRLRFLQAGRVQLYILYIALTLLILLIWNLK